MDAVSDAVPPAASADPSRLRAYLSLFAKYGLGLGLLAWVIASYWSKIEDGEQVGISAVLVRRLDGWAFAGAAVVCLVAIFVTLVRWYLLVKAQGLPFTFRDAIRLGLVGLYFSSFLPGSVGGDLIKAAFLCREQSRRSVAVATVILDRVIGLAGLFWLTALLGGGMYASGALDGLLADTQARWTYRTILTASIGFASGSVAGWLVLGWLPTAWLDRLDAKLRTIRKVGGPLAELLSAVRVYRRQGGYVLAALGLSIVSHLGFVLTFYLSAAFFAPADRLPPFAAHLLLVPVGMTIQAGIPLPGGLGGAEYGYGMLYRLGGFRFADGVLGSLGQRMLLWFWGLVGYVVYLRMKRTSLPCDVTPPSRPT